MFGCGYAALCSLWLIFVVFVANRFRFRRSVARSSRVSSKLGSLRTMQDLTTGSLTRHLLTTTGLMLVSMVFQTLYVLVDLYWVGRLGTEAVAAVAISGNLQFVVLGATQMLGVGTTALVAHAVGRKDRARAVLVFNQSQLLSILAGTLFMVVMMSLRLPYASQLAADDTTAALTTAYLGWFIPAMGMQFALVAMAGALRGAGDFKPGMVVQPQPSFSTCCLLRFSSLAGVQAGRLVWPGLRSQRSSQLS
jgi:Na+-driven multidrug efflux pump